MSTKTICSDLDKLAISYIECYQEILFNRQLLNDCLDDAYLNLSKARSLIGCNRLSLLQIPNEFDANLFVSHETDGHMVNEKLSYDKFSLVSTDDNEDVVVQTKLPNWFGVFTPLNLKTSQKSFFKSVNIILNVCELQSKLNAIEIEYKNLLEKKTNILKLED